MHHKVILEAYDNWLGPIPLNTFYVGNPNVRHTTCAICEQSEPLIVAAPEGHPQGKAWPMDRAFTRLKNTYIVRRTYNP